MARDMEEGAGTQGRQEASPQAGIGGTFPAPFQASCAVPKPPAWPRGQILQPLECAALYHPRGLWFGDQRCNVLSQHSPRAVFGHSVALLQLPMQKDHSLGGEKPLPAQHQHQYQPG